MGKGKTQIGWKDKGGSVQENHPGVGLFTTSVDLVTMHVPKIDGQICFSSLCQWHELSFLKTSFSLAWA